MISDASSTCCVLHSGGLDSSILVAQLLRDGELVQPLYVRSQLTWERTELPAADGYLRSIAQARLRPLIVLNQPVDDLYEDHWSVTGANVPDLISTDESVYLPGRNALLVVKAALWCQLNGVRRLAMAPLKTSPFADASSSFFENLERAMNWSGPADIDIERPFETLTKQQVMRLGAGLPLELTFSCLAPRRGQHCGACNKCGERQRAFASVGVTDRTHYLTSTGPLPLPNAPIRRAANGT